MILSQGIFTINATQSALQSEKNKEDSAKKVNNDLSQPNADGRTHGHTDAFGISAQLTKFIGCYVPAAKS